MDIDQVKSNKRCYWVALWEMWTPAFMDLNQYRGLKVRISAICCIGGIDFSHSRFNLSPVGFLTKLLQDWFKETMFSCQPQDIKDTEYIDMAFKSTLRCTSKQEWVHSAESFETDLSDLCQAYSPSQTVQTLLGFSVVRASLSTAWTDLIEV